MNCQHCTAPTPYPHDRSDIPQHHDPYILHDRTHLSIHLFQLTRLGIPDYSLVLLGSFELGMAHWWRLVRMQRLVCHILMSTPSASALTSFHFSTKLLYHSVHSDYRCDKLEMLRWRGLHLRCRRTVWDLDKVPLSVCMVYSSC